MSLQFKSYDPVRHQQRAERRRQKRSAERPTFVPSSAACFGTPPQSLVAGPKCSGIDEKLIPSTNPVASEDPYSGYLSVEDILEFWSSLDTDVSSVYTPTSANPLSYPDSAIGIQDVSSDSSCQEEAYKDDQLGRKLLRAITTLPSASKLNNRRKAHYVNASGTLVSTTVSAEESDTGMSPVEHVWSANAETTPSTTSSNITPASVTSPIFQKQTSTWRNQDSSVDNEAGAQDPSIGMPGLSGLDLTSKDALSGVGLPVLECQNNTAPELLSSNSSNRPHSQDDQASRILASAASTIEESFTEPSVTELSLTQRTPAQDAASSSAKRSFSERGATNDSQLSSSDVCHSSKRLRLTSTSSEKAISKLLDIQKMISSVLAELCQDQPHSPIPDVNAQSMADTIEVAGDEVGDGSSDDSSTHSSFDDSESEREVTILQPRCSQQRSSQRRRWTEKEEKLLRALKGTQKRNGGKPSDYQIASRLDRTESGIKQHWGIMSQKKHR
ncbi:hypothetical protein BFJ63_vAg18328 [Fusarium oxysporum f. sp. narcissi]|uniref:Myb-like domain-containing protein n=1 Tax=Fusarium oxysporum f. sp. narcissi TaxID=451672 RepID=A0A4Q2V4M2_FUSOX|nr:hypothetical protein BFJ63_vAg18328 [Fusarium oxysporum f. sp. narcissi]